MKFTAAIDTGALPPEPLVAAHLNRGVSNYNLQNCPAAIPDFDFVIQATPDAPGPYAARGQCLYNDYVTSQDPAKATASVADVQRAVALAPDDVSFSGQLCSITFNLKMYDQSDRPANAMSTGTPEPGTVLDVMEAAAASYEQTGKKATQSAMWKCCWRPTRATRRRRRASRAIPDGAARILPHSPATD